MKSAITVGNYDGIHIAHKKIITKLLDYSINNSLTPFVYTFSNHPKEFFTGNPVKKILTEQEKTQILNQLGVKIINRKFDKEFSQLSANQFITILQEKYGLQALFTGDDHRFGRNRHCDHSCMEKLSRQLNFKLFNISSVFVDNERVSSSAVRSHILDGTLHIANKMLGYDFFITGNVVTGNRLGRRIGFPTANISPPTEKIIPATGVYAAYTILDGKKFPAMVNIGYKPTVAIYSKINIEVHIINFNRDLYGKQLKVNFVKKIRDEKKFHTINDLAKQLQNDKNTTLNIINKINSLTVTF